MNTEKSTKLAVFEGKHIRKVLHDGEWWFAVIDIVEVLTDSVNPKGYIKDMRRRDPELFKGGWQAEVKLRQHRGTFPYHSVDSLAQGGAAQTLAGSGGQGADRRD